MADIDYPSVLQDEAKDLTSVKAAAERLTIPLEEAARRAIEMADIGGMRSALEPFSMDERAYKIAEAIWWAGRYLQ